ncbi:MAG TPA: prepilin-type N-terminal cleavage/methylation domain-containing protein [Armatimonadota bacterium]|jgi:general secretion pathway protein G
MSLSKFAVRRRGFTLIELLIVIVVIAILALIVIPRLMGASRKAKDSTLKANLQILRNAVSQYEADCGMYPDILSSLTGTTTSQTGVPAGAYKGPYLKDEGAVIPSSGGIPVNPYDTAATPTYTTSGTSWAYAGVSTGTVKVGSALSGTDADGKAYNAY